MSIDDPRSEVSKYIERMVIEGFCSESDIVSYACEMAADEYKQNDLESFIKEQVSLALENHRIEEATWSYLTDCDKLDIAFSELEKQGIVARQNFACCQNCGHAEMPEQIQAASLIRKVVGYTFYHMQDTERAAQGGGLYLAFDTIEGGVEEQSEIGERIKQSLLKAGLSVEWSGDYQQRISIPLVWHKRRFSKCPIVMRETYQANANLNDETVGSIKRPWWRFWS